MFSGGTCWYHLSVNFVGLVSALHLEIKAGYAGNSSSNNLRELSPAYGGSASDTAESTAEEASLAQWQLVDMVLEGVGMLCTRSCGNKC